MPARIAPEPDAPVRPSRRERRAKHKDVPALPVRGPVAGRRHPVPNRQRDYAVRRRG